MDFKSRKKKQTITLTACGFRRERGFQLVPAFQNMAFSAIDAAQRFSFAEPYWDDSCRSPQVSVQIPLSSHQNVVGFEEVRRSGRFLRDGIDLALGLFSS
jgi:hypothetical protein